MILRTAALVGLLSAATHVSADVAPEITTLAEGYNYIAKLPCLDCPYLYQDQSNGAGGPWIDRVDDNALLLNISLSYDASYISINSVPLLTSSSILPRIHASQVLQDCSQDDLHQRVSNGNLNTTDPVLSLSYGTSLHRITNSSALVFRFNVFSASFPLTSPPLTIALDGAKQKVIELLLMPRPLQSPGDVGPSWEIVSARLSAREKKGSKHRMQIMMLDEWDEFGRKGSPRHLVTSFFGGIVKYASSGLWGLSMAILGFLVLFVGVVVACVVGWERYGGEYEQAQGGKSRRSASKGSGSWADVEKAKGRFSSASELGMGGGGSVVGGGKSD